MLVGPNLVTHNTAQASERKTQLTTIIEISDPVSDLALLMAQVETIQD
jgi:hypothetical protein